MKPKVSIIVPIYNVENYLSRCLDSLLLQNLQDLEIIAINDGSTDLSQRILEEYAKKNPIIKVLNKKNAGVSSARNEGLKLATGDYIGFVDPDDWIEKEMYESLYQTAIKEKADVVMCTYFREFGTHSKEKKFELPEKVAYYGSEVQSKVMRRLIGPIKQEVANPEFLDAWGTVWSKLYKSELIKENGLSFTDLQEIGTSEDSLFNIEVLYHAQSFVFLNKPYYHYWRENSASVTSGYKPNLIGQWKELYRKLSSFIHEKNMNEEFLIALNNRICLNTLGLGLNTISPGNQTSAATKIKMIKTILNDQHIKRSFKQFELSFLPFVWRTFYFFAKLRAATGFYLMLVMINFLRRTLR